MKPEEIKNRRGDVELKLISVAIPTYNRSAFLDLCLAQISKQMSGNEQYLEVIVSDNASSDNTAEIVQKYISAGFPISYVKNSENIGADNNITQAFQLARAKYVLVLADDDVLVDDALSRIVSLLKTGDYGVVHLNSYPYRRDFAAETPKRNSKISIVYDDRKRFVKKVNYFFTFLSGNIVNKTLVNKDLAIEQFNNTNMIQLSWTFSALFNAPKNAYMEQWTIAAKSDNTGGYKICKVFGVNLNKVFDIFAAQGVDKAYFRIINRRLLFSFFPNYIRTLRKNPGNYHQEDYFATLYPVLGGYVNFWLFSVPAMVLPLPMVRFHMFIIRELSKTSKRFGRYRDAMFEKVLS